MDLSQIITVVVSAPGFLYFILYYRLRKKELKVKIKNDEIDSLSKIVHELKDEIKRKDQERQDYLNERSEDRKRMSDIENDNSLMKKRISGLETGEMNNVIALSAVSLCIRPKCECPIINKINELKGNG